MGSVSRWAAFISSQLQRTSVGDGHERWPLTRAVDLQLVKCLTVPTRANPLIPLGRFILPVLQVISSSRRIMDVELSAISVQARRP